MRRTARTCAANDSASVRPTASTSSGARGVGGQHGVGVDVVVAVGPAAQRLGAGLGVELHAPRRPDPERLVRVHGRRRQPDRAARQVDDGVRVHARLRGAVPAVRERRDGSDDRVTGGLGAPAHVDEPGLAPGRGRDLHAAATRDGEQLGAEADAERRDALGARVGEQRAQLGQPRGAGVVVRRHVPAEDDEAVADLVGDGHALTGERRDDAQLDVAEPLAEAVEGDVGRALDDGDDRATVAVQGDGHAETVPPSGGPSTGNGRPICPPCRSIVHICPAG